MSDDIDPNEAGLLELAKRLEAYADARLSPSGAGTNRMRTKVMTAAHRRAALVAADATFDPTGATTTSAGARARAATNAWRRPAAAILAGCLTLAMLVGTAYATKPGGMLYGARLWTEMANLPADVVARAQAEINRLDARLHEAQQASSAGDAPAAEAALSAYSVIVFEAAKGSSGDPTASAALEISVTHHVVVLTLMVDSVPPPARAAVEHALSSSAMVLDDLNGAGTTNGRHAARGANLSTAPEPPTRSGPIRHPAVGEAAPAPADATDATDATDAVSRRPEKPDKHATSHKTGHNPGHDPQPARKRGSDGPGHGDQGDAQGDDPSGDPPADPNDAGGDPSTPLGPGET